MTEFTGRSAVIVTALFLATAQGALAQGRATNSILLQPSGCSATQGVEQPWLNPAYSPECRAQYVLDSFKTLDEKLDALLAPGFGAAKWMTDRGLPMLRGGDGPAGVRGAGVAVTSFPSPLSVAASFDAQTAQLYGSTLGAEFHDFGMNRMGGPALDVTRTWNFGRSTESFGEDPFLIASMAGPEIAAIQSHHVLSMAKHFAVYTQEQGRGGDHPLRLKPAGNNLVSERAIREIYFPGFEAAVKVGKVGQIMCSFPRINGIYACEHPSILSVLKGEWGFDGSVVPDFPDAQRSIIAAVNAGLDTGTMVGTAPTTGGGQGLGAIPIDNTFNGENLRTAVQEGKVSAARIDDLILRRLVSNFRVGAFDHPAKRIGEDVSTPERRATATEIITRGAVLLKNTDGILPLGPQVKSVAIIGDQAGPGATVAELGSAHVNPFHLTPVLTAVRERAGNSMQVVYARGTLGLERLPAIPTSMVRSVDGKAGFRAEYFANPRLDFSAAPFLARQEPAVNNVDLPTTGGFPPDRAWSARWTGLFTPFEEGVQHFTLNGSGTARLYIAGKLVGEYANNDFSDTLYANVSMTAGKAVEVRVEWTPRVTVAIGADEQMGTTLGPVVRLGWSGPNDLIATAVAAARQADVAVVFVGHKVGEGMDRQHLALSNDQDALIEAVAAVNPHTVVVLQTGGAVSMPWLSKVAGVLQTWLGGDSTGPATAKLLFGDAEPGGRLPVTFPSDESQGPARERHQYPGTLDATGAIDQVHFDEDLLVGYRYWDAKGQVPLFPFGYGLSYTRFEVTGRGVTTTADGGARVNVAVRNTGTRNGSEVIQVYLGFPPAAGEPPKQLKGFAKVELKPGEARTLHIALSPQAFKHWDSAQQRWRVQGGQYQVMVGTSSRDIKYSKALGMAGR